MRPLAVRRRLDLAAVVGGVLLVAACSSGAGTSTASTDVPEAADDAATGSEVTLEVSFDEAGLESVLASGQSLAVVWPMSTQSGSVQDVVAVAFSPGESNSIVLDAEDLAVVAAPAELQVGEVVEVAASQDVDPGTTVTFAGMEFQDGAPDPGLGDAVAVVVAGPQPASVGLRSPLGVNGDQRDGLLGFVSSPAGATTQLAAGSKLELVLGTNLVDGMVIDGESSASTVVDLSGGGTLQYVFDAGTRTFSPAG